MKYVILLISSILLSLNASAGIFDFFKGTFGAKNYLEYDFNGVAKLSNCSGALFRFKSSVGEDKALVLTNGHCVKLNSKLIAPGFYVSNIITQRKISLFDSNYETRSFQASRLVFATLSISDLAIYELNKTYTELENLGIDSFLLNDTATLMGIAIDIPSGKWKKGFRCSTEAEVKVLKEGKWLFQSSIRYSDSGCNIFGGTSGAPVIASGTREIVAINNTYNSGQNNCSINNPCELKGEEFVSFPKRGYAQQTYLLYGCFDLNNKFNIDNKDCIFKNLTKIRN